MQRIAFTFLVIGAWLAIASCAGTNKSDGRQAWMGHMTLDAERPAETLARLAAREQAHRAPEHRTIPPPPGVNPVLLRRRANDDPHAHMELQQAVAEVTGAYPWRDVLDTAARDLGLDDLQPIEPAEETAALRHYIRGREAAYDKRYFAAITTLQRAREYDPHSTEILRELARSYLATGNQSRATETYVRLAILKPDDPEALFMMALSAAERGDHELAVATFGQRRMSSHSFAHDPVAGLILTYALSESLWELGYDRAAITAASYVAEAPANLADHSIFEARVRAIEQRHDGLGQRIGDAHVRLGEYEQALEAYTRASQHLPSEPGTLHPRKIFVLLRLGRTYMAQYEMFRSLEVSQPIVSDRDARLAAYVAEHAGDTRWLRDAVLALYEQHTEEPSLARTAASLMPTEEARELLEEFVERRPRDLHVVSELLAWLGTRDAEAAVRVTAALVTRHPDLAGAYISRLAHAVPEPAALLTYIDRLDASPQRAVLRSRLLAILGALGEAWNAADSARHRWLDEPMLYWLQLDLAALLDEPMLLSGILRDEQRFVSPWTKIIQGRAHRGLGQIHEAIRAGEEALSKLERTDPKDMTDVQRSARLTAKIELGMSYLVLAKAQADDLEQQRWARKAVDLAERALLFDKRRDDGFELLIAAYGADGPLRDAYQVRQIAQRLREHDPEGRVYMLAAAQEAILRGQYDEAIERLLTMYEGNPYDPSPLDPLVTAWSRANRLDDALTWLTAQLEVRPGNPILLEHWVTVMNRQGNSEAAINALQDMIASTPRSPGTPAAMTAKRLLERVYRQRGMVEEAFALGEERLRSRPRGIRRETELAALYGGVDRYDEALERLIWIAGRTQHATLDQLTTAIAILARMEPTDVKHDPLTIQLVERTIEMYPTSAPLQVHGSGLRALSRQGLLGERFNAIAEHAALYAPRASGSTVQAALAWRDLAQALVDDDHALAAARALRARLFTESPLERDAIDVLGTVTLAAYAAAAAEADGPMGEEVVQFTRELAARELLPRLFTIDGTPTTADVLFHTSSFFDLLGGKESAEQVLRAVVKIRPDHGIALNNLGYGRIDRGYDDQQTILWVERAYELAGSEASVVDTLGWLRYLQGTFADEEDRHGALTLIKRSHEMAEQPSAEVLDHLGDVYWRLGERERAVDAWTEAAEILSEQEHHEQWTQNFYLLQVHGWGLLVADPETLYHEQFGALLEQLREKIDAAEQGNEPAVAPTFAEMNSG